MGMELKQREMDKDSTARGKTPHRSKIKAR